MNRWSGQEPLDVRQERAIFTRGRWWPLIAGGSDPPADPPADDSPPPASPPPSPPPASPPPGQEPPERYDAEYVKELRRSEAATRRKAAELEARLKELDDAKLSETERLAKQLAEAQADLATAQAERQALVVRHAVERAAVDAGWHDPADAWRFLDLAALEYDEHGAPRNLSRLLADVLKEKPYLAKSDGGAGVPPTPRGAPPPSREDVVAAKSDALRKSGAYSRF